LPIAAGERWQQFQTILRQKGIAEATAAIPEDIGRYRQGVLTADELIPIRPIEEFPLDEPSRPSRLTNDESRLLFAQFQLQSIAQSPTLGVQAPPEAACVGPVVQFPT
jgi:hypothetical protein